MKKYLFLTTFLLLGVMVHAAQKLVINGEEVQKTVATITLDGDNVVLTFSDQSQQTADMATVIISFDTDASAIHSLKSPVGSMLDVSGLTEGTELTIYDATGKKLLSTKASKDTSTLSVENLKNGVYILKAGNKIVKFLKR